MFSTLNSAALALTLSEVTSSNGMHSRWAKSTRPSERRSCSSTKWKDCMDTILVSFIYPRQGPQLLPCPFSQWTFAPILCRPRLMLAARNPLPAGSDRIGPAHGASGKGLGLAFNNNNCCFFNHHLMLNHLWSYLSRYSCRLIPNSFSRPKNE